MLACFGFDGFKFEGFNRSCLEKPVYPFTSFVVKVDPNVKWEKSMAKILKKTKLEVSSLKMYGGGLFQISGKLDPRRLLKVLAKTDKTAELVGLQSGGCSQNLYMPGFEKKQKMKSSIKNKIEMQSYYMELYQKYNLGYAQAYHGYNYGNPYGRNYGPVQYLPA